MKLVLQHCASRVAGVLSGFDRLALHGSPWLFSYPPPRKGRTQYCTRNRVRDSSGRKEDSGLSNCTGRVCNVLARAMLLLQSEGREHWRKP